MLSWLPDRCKVYILDTFTVFFFIEDSCLFFGFLSCRSFPVRYPLEGGQHGPATTEAGAWKVTCVWGDVACAWWAASSGSLHSFVVRVCQVRSGEQHGPVGQAGTANVRVVPPAHRIETQSRSHACACSFNLSFTQWASCRLVLFRNLTWGQICEQGKI